MMKSIASGPNSVADFVREDHIWLEQRLYDVTTGRPALFVDRDGVIVEEVNYLHRASDTRTIEGAGSTLAQANQLGIPVIMITNQAGIGRGYYGWSDFAAVDQAMNTALAAQHARVDIVVACPFHDEGVTPWRHDDHPMRKPNPGMLLLAGTLLGVDFTRSLVVGDKACDLLAGRAAGLRRGVLVDTGHGPQHRQQALQASTPDFEVLLADSLADPLIQATLQRMSKTNLS